MLNRHLIMVAAPLTSRGGVYNYMTSACEELSRQATATSVIYGSRVGELPFPHAQYVERVEESHGPAAYALALRAAITRRAAAVPEAGILSMLPQSDVACALLPRRMREQWSAMIHGRPVPAVGEQQWLRRTIWRIAVLNAYKRALRVLAVSNSLVAEAREIGLTRPVIVVPNGVRPAEGAQPRSVPREPVVGFLGRFSAEKGPDLFLEIASLLESQAVMFGDGPMRDHVAARARALNVRLGGWAPPAEALAQVDVLVMPSRREGLGLVLLEAGARGVPVVAPAVGGLAEILSKDPFLWAHCVYGSDPSDIDACLRTLRPLLHDAGLRLEVGRRLRELVTREHLLADQVRTLLRVLFVEEEQNS